jgi:hypothetical protein
MNQLVPHRFTQQALCQHLEMDYRQVAKIAKYLGMATHDYLQAKTNWILYEEYYYPPGTSVQTIQAVYDLTVA